MKCDFCSDPNPTWCYPTTSFFVVVLGCVHESVGNWAACDTCHELIETNCDVELWKRSIDTFKIHEGFAMPLDARTNLLTVHKKFFANRTEPAERI